MQDLDFLWFKKNYEALYKEYGSCCIAIKNQRVLGVYDSHVSALQNTLKTEEPGSFIVQYCSESRDSYSCYIASTSFTD